jgi:hypothetical protein
MPVRIYEWRRGAPTGGTVKEQAAKELANDVALLCDQLIDWTIPEKIEAKTLSCLHAPIISALLQYVTGYAADEQKDAEKNSSSEPG